MGEKTMRVLILDDERAFRESLAGALRAKGFQVDTAATGQEAIDKVRENRGDYDLLIIDQVLREPPDGIEVMAQLRQEYPHIPAIVFTAWGDRESGIRAMKEGAFLYVFKGDELASDIKRIRVLIESAIELERLRKREELRKRLLEITQVMQGKVGDLKAVLEEIAEATKALVEADEAAVSLWDPAVQRFKIYYRTTFNSDKSWRPHFKKGYGSLSRLILEQGHIYIKDAERDERINPAVLETGIRSILGVPVGKQGVLYAYGRIAHQFDEEDVLTLQALASQAAVALQNARLFEQTQRSLRHLREAADFLPLGSFERVVDSLVRSVKEATLCDAVVLYPYDLNRKQLNPRPRTLGLRKPEILEKATEIKAGSVPERVLTEWKPIFAYDAPSHPIMQGDFVRREGIRSSAAIPISKNGGKLGILFVNYRRPHFFSDEEKDLLQSFANLAAIALYNAWLHTRLERRNIHLEALRKAIMAVAESTEREEVFKIILQEATRLTESIGGGKGPAHFASIMEKEGDVLRFVAAWPPEEQDQIRAKLGESIDLREGKEVIVNGRRERRIGVTGRAAITGQPQLVPDVSEDPDYILYHPETRSVLAVPIKLKREGEDKYDKYEVIGVLNLEHKDLEAFDEEDKEIVEALANKSAIAIDKAKHYARIRKELEEARKRQTATAAVSMMWMTSAVLLHEIKQDVSIILNEVWLLEDDLKRGLFRIPFLRKPVEKRANSIKAKAQAIQRIAMRSSLAPEEKEELIRVNAWLQERIIPFVKRENIKVKWHLALPKRAQVRGNRNWFNQAIDILVRNAFEAMRKVPERDNVLAVTTRAKNGYAEILISDTGPGIQPEVRPYILKEPVPRDKAEGLGIGLLIARTIFRAKGGDLELKETGPEGTTMMITLPLEGE